MGFRLIRGKLHFAAAFVAAPALAFGYYAGNPDNLGIAVNAALSGSGSVHGRQAPPASEDAGYGTIAREAAHLFRSPQRGPRADKYVMLTRSTRGTETVTRVAKAGAAQADMTVTGALPRETPRKVAALASQPAAAEARSQPEPKAQPEFNRSRETSLLPMVPVAQRSSAALFLATLSGVKPADYSELKEMRDGDEPDREKLQTRRGLKFAGETEIEYQVRQRRCLATAIYFEARGESEKGQVAVAQVVMNRVRSSLYPDTICGVVYQGQHRRTGCQFSFTCDGVADVPRDKDKWRQANKIAQRVTEGDGWLGDIGHATHYHANYVWPRWRRELNKIKQVGRHIFYRVRGEQIEDALTGEDAESPAQGLALSKNG